MIRLYYIREFDSLLPEHFQEPRTPNTVRRSIDGSICLLAFYEGTQPDGWHDGMDNEVVKDLLNAPEAFGIWYDEQIA